MRRKIVTFSLFTSLALLIVGTAYVGIALAAVCAINPALTASGNDFGYSSSRATIYAQSFTVSSACTVSAASVYLSKNGSPSDAVSFFLKSDSAGVPGSTLDTGTTVAGSSLSSGGVYTHATSTFSGGVSLSLSTTYWLVIQRSGSNDSSNYYYAYYAAGSGGKQYYNGAWGSIGDDLTYEVDGTSAATSSSVVEATSTPDQVQENWIAAWMLYFSAMVFMVWLFRNKSS